MIKSIYKIVIYFLVFVTLQVLILHNIYLFKIATPLLYLYIIVKVPTNMTRSQLIFISFILGIVIDIFYNTLGMHAAACTLAGMFRAPLMHSFTDKELSEGATPSYRTLGTRGFIKYVFFLVVIHHVALFLIESISLFDPLFLIFRIFACVMLTVLFIFIVEAFNRERKDGES